MEEGTETFLLGWKGDWIKVDLDGQVGWVASEYTYGGRECIADYFRPSYRAWEQSNEP